MAEARRKPVAAPLSALSRSTLLSLRAAYERAAREMDAAVTRAFLDFGAPSTWSFSDLQQAQRQAWLMDRIVSRIDALTREIGDNAWGTYDAYREGYFTRGWTLSQALPANTFLLLPIIPEQAILAAITFPYKDAGFFERLGDALAQFIIKLRSSITASQIRGEGMYQAQKRLANELGWDIRRTTKALKAANQEAFAKTELIARTEMMRALNLGAALADEQNRDVVKGWEWLCAKDERTCPICGSLDGKTWPLGQGERPPIHPGCRCTSVPVTKTWAELGLPDIGPVFPPRETYREWRLRMGMPPLREPA